LTQFLVDLGLGHANTFLAGRVESQLGRQHHLQGLVLQELLVRSRQRSVNHLILISQVLKRCLVLQVRDVVSVYGRDNLRIGRRVTAEKRQPDVQQLQGKGGRDDND